MIEGLKNAIIIDGVVHELVDIEPGFGPDFRLNYDNIMCSSHVKSTIN